MNWPAIFLGCFVIGFVLSALSFALGAMHAHLHIHLPWGHHIHGDLFHGGHPSGVGPINFATMTAFLAWFGGAGYLLTSEFRWLALPAVVLSVVIGLGGAAIVFWLIGELIYSHGGARHSCGARSADGGAIEKGAEVVVTDYERGIASVRRWTDLASDR